MPEITRNPKQYPLLRNLQYSPLKQEGDQYIVLWDPTRISTEKLIIPLSYFFVIQHFDGEHSLEQIATLYLKKFGEFLNPDSLYRLVDDLDDKLFLEGARFEAAKEAAKTAYRNAPIRKAYFAGKSYPEDKEKLLAQIDSFYSSKEGPEIKASINRGKTIRALVAPHYELREAGPIYAWAYKELKEAVSPDLFVIVGTCHAGLEQLYALTDKDFETPLGHVPIDRPILDRLRATMPAAFFEEELSHQQEHTIEFQLPFIQHAKGLDTPITLVPVLCAFSAAHVTNPQFAVERERIDLFARVLRDALAASGRAACLIASAELAHLGLRYGDAGPPTDFAFHRCMQNDLEMLKHVEDGDPQALADYIAKEQDGRRVSGFAPIYTLLKLLGDAKGQVLRYDRGITDQFNSTVTYASMVFFDEQK